MKTQATQSNIILKDTLLYAFVRTFYVPICQGKVALTMKPALTRNTTRATEVTLAFERNNTEQKRVVQPNAVHACYT